MSEPAVARQVDAPAWLRIINGELPLDEALAAGALSVTGSLERLHDFFACFPHLR